MWADVLKSAEIGAPGEIRTPDLLVRSYTRAPLLSSPDYAGVRSFNGLFIGFFFLAYTVCGRYDRAW